jgi:hypothetical protein
MSGKQTTTDVSNSSEANILTDLRASDDAPAPGPELSGLSTRRARRLNTQSFVLALVLTASAGSLYMMRKQGMKAGLNLDTQVKFTDDIAKIRTTTTATQQRILADLERSTSPLETPLEKLRKNPFLLPEDKRVSGPPESANPRAEREAQIMAALGNVQLNGVMQGPIPLARVNNKLVRVGDRIDKIFLVAQIHDRSIDLIADGQTYTLNMGDGPANPTRPNPRAPAATPHR